MGRLWAIIVTLVVIVVAGSWSAFGQQCYLFQDGCQETTGSCPGGYIGGNGGPCGTNWYRKATWDGDYSVASCALLGQTGWTVLKASGAPLTCQVWSCMNVNGYCTNPQVLQSWPVQPMQFDEEHGQLCEGACQIAMAEPTPYITSEPMALAAPFPRKTVLASARP